MEVLMTYLGSLWVQESREPFPDYMHGTSYRSRSSEACMSKIWTHIHIPCRKPSPMSLTALTCKPKLQETWPPTSFPSLKRAETQVRLRYDQGRFLTILARTTSISGVLKRYRGEIKKNRGPWGPQTVNYIFFLPYIIIINSQFLFFIFYHYVFLAI
jgi:hypothetical protein